MTSRPTAYRVARRALCLAAVIDRAHTDDEHRPIEARRRLVRWLGEVDSTTTFEAASTRPGASGFSTHS